MPAQLGIENYGCIGMLVFRATGCESGRHQRPLHSNHLLGLPTQVRQCPRGSTAPSRCLKWMATISSCQWRPHPGLPQEGSSCHRLGSQWLRLRLRVGWHLHAEGQGRAALGRRSEEGDHLRASQGCRAHVSDGSGPSQVHWIQHSGVGVAADVRLRTSFLRPRAPPRQWARSSRN